MKPTTFKGSNHAFFGVKTASLLVFLGISFSISASAQADSTRMWALLDSALQFRTYDLPRTKALINEGLEVAYDIDHKYGQASGLNRLGLVSMLTSDYTTSLSSFNASKRLYRELGNEDRLAVVYTNLGMLYFELSNYVKSLECYEKAEEIRDEIGVNNGALASAMANIANIRYVHMGDTLGAIEAHLKAKKIFIEIGNLADASGCAANLAMIHTETGNFDLAEEYLKEGENQLQQTNARIYLPYMLITRANLYSARGYSDKAMEFASRAAEEAEKTKQYNIARDAHWLLYEKKKERGLYKQSLLAHEQYRAFFDSIQSNEQKKLLAEIEYRSLLSEKEMELAAETERNDMQSKITIYVAIALGLAVFLVVVLLSAYRRNKRTNSLLYKQKGTLEAQASKLEAMDREKTRLFGVISHDLRGPISNLGGLLELIKNDSLSHEDFKILSDRLSHHFGHLSASLDNLLLWAKKQMNDAPPEMEDLNISHATDDVIAFLQSTAQKKGVLLQNTISDKLHVHADIEQVKVVLRNLLSNAIKFTREGGKVSISASRGFQNEVRISVKDNGVGIPKDVQARLLDNTDPISTYGTTGERGTGLGLSLCKDFIEANGGELWFESEENEGSVFFFTLAESQVKSKMREAQAS